MAAPLLFGLFNAVPASRWFEPPMHALRQVEVCANDGYLAVEGCETERVFIPLHSHLELQSTNNPRVNLDPSGRFRVDSDCASPGEMRHTRWFVLPPAEEFYYRRVHAEYRPLPALRMDCGAARVGGRPALALLYPDPNSKVLIPQELDGQRGRTGFEAVHRRRDATLYWHLDDRYLGETHTFHQQSLDIDPGEHILTVVDDEGERVARRFQVVATR
jgi:penicillin-binding protein 1C